MDKNKKSKDPSFLEAYGKRFEYGLIILKYIWPSFVIFLGGLLIIIEYEEYLSKYTLLGIYSFSGIFVLVLLILAVVVNVFYYIWIRSK